ncbi:hypothetical protein Micbo1qcDRAFT_164294, partial [Microdochium bolleyi]
MPRSVACRSPALRQALPQGHLAPGSRASGPVRPLGTLCLCQLAHPVRWKRHAPSCPVVCCPATKMPCSNQL